MLDETEIRDGLEEFLGGKPDSEAREVIDTESVNTEASNSNLETNTCSYVI